MASEFGFRVEGLDDLRAAFEKKKIQIQEANVKIVNDSVLVVVKNTKKRFRPRQAGDKVISKRTGNPWYRETPPYQPEPPDPTSRSGALVAHIGFEVSPVGVSGALGIVGPTLLYGKYVAQGSKPAGTGTPKTGVGRGNNRRPFPYLENGLKDSESEIGEIARATYAEALEA